MSDKTIKFWYIGCDGSYASGVWFPFKTQKEAIDFVKEDIKEHEIVFEGFEDGIYVIKTNTKTIGFNEFAVLERNTEEILKHEYIE